VSAGNSGQLAAFLRSRRARLTPADVGLPADSEHLYAWIPLIFLPAKEAAERVGDPVLATAIRAAAGSYRSLSEQDFYADNRRALEPAYLRGTTPQEGSGFGGGPGEWRQARRHITEAIDHDGTFLDVGCANGLMMESAAAWCAERGLDIEPYGVDISSKLAGLARRRLPQWAGRIWAGNAVDWRPPDDRRFDYVHILLECVPRARRADLIRHHLAHTVQPGTGRLLVSDYTADPATGHPAAPETVRSLGFRVAGQTSGGDRPGRVPLPTAWSPGSGPGAS
jgi:hypothetical protein